MTTTLVSDKHDTKLGSLRQLWHHFHSAVVDHLVKPPQHILEKIAVALEDARQWLDSHIPQDDLSTFEDQTSGQYVHKNAPASNTLRDKVFPVSSQVDRIPPTSVEVKTIRRLLVAASEDNIEHVPLLMRRIWTRDPVSSRQTMQIRHMAGAS